ncbi:MAG: hypothetical protein M4579_003113 [Chaenotheca gracillima]|nr:MAG: hypothetical protein M4579_003113 [Chaenotheca gracillima]
MSNNAPQARGPQGQIAQQLQNAVRAEHVQKLPHLNEVQKRQYEEGLRRLWSVIQNQPPESEASQSARTKLLEISANIKNAYKRWQQANPNQGQQQGGQQQGGQQQGGQQQGGQQPQNPQRAAAPQMPRPQEPAMQMSQPGGDLRTHVENFPYLLPPSIPPDSDQAQQWLSEAKSRYGSALFMMEKNKLQLQQLQGRVTAEQAKGKNFTPEELRDIHEKKSQFQKQYAESKNYTEKFRLQQHEQGAQSQDQKRPQSASKEQLPPTSNSGVNQPPQHSHLPNPSSHPTAAQGSPAPAPAPSQGVNAAVEAVRNQSAAGARASMSPSVSGQFVTGQAPTQQPNPQVHPQGQSSQPQSAVSTHQPPTQLPQQPPNLATAPGQLPNSQSFPNVPQAPQPNSPQSSQAQLDGQAGPPRPLTHQGAIAKARSSIDANPNPTPTSGIGFPPPRETNTPKMPIPKNLNVPTPQPVSMPQARPTFSGGASNGANGMMGQPAFQKTPAFVLEGESERVLSKKKVDELVRQVTGAGEALGGEGLTADVEELILQLADDFVDQVVTSACRVAKLRNSSTLEIRDIQLILERNYNIRVPGYASDEIRTVRKFAPSQGWSQKMSAVQAAKIAGGKVDL